MTFQNIQNRTSDQQVVRRPPGALRDTEFHETCVKCLDCLAVCPSQALGVDGHGYPCLISPRQCGNCGLCADVCMQGAIVLTERTRIGLELVKLIESTTDTP